MDRNTQPVTGAGPDHDEDDGDIDRKSFCDK